jgi:indole-3-glycerol phosphate synthase
MTTLLDIGQTKQRWLASTDDLPATAEGLSLAKGQFIAMLRQATRNGLPCQLIAEIKPKSPSAGVLAARVDLPALVRAYDQVAQGFSVLTDEPYFNGSFDNLLYVTQHSRKPALCKDFILDARQIWHARAYGAEAILLIVKLLTQDVFITLVDHCRQWGMTPVIEIQNLEELTRAMAVNPDCLLINNRNLMTFAIDMTTTPRLLPHIPPDVAVIAASGYGTDAEAMQAVAPTVNAVLMGSHLMTTPHAQLLPALQAMARHLGH